MSENQAIRALLGIRQIAHLNALQQAIYGDPQQRISIVGIAPTAETLTQNTIDIAPDLVVADASFAMDMGEQRFLQFIQNLSPDTIAVALVPVEYVPLKDRLGAMGDKVKEIADLPLRNPALLVDRIAEVGWAHNAIRREVQMKSVPGADLPAMMHGAAMPAPTIANQKVVVCAAFKGGPGKTTIAVNLWAFLNRRWGSVVAPSLLVGMDVPDDCVAQIGFAPRHSLVNYFARPNETGFQAALLHSPDKYPLISAPETYGEVSEHEAIIGERIRSLLYTVRGHPYLAIVVDVPPGYSDWTIEPMMMASVVLLIVEPDPANVRKVVIGLREIDRYGGIAKNKLYLVINKMRPHSPNTPRDVAAQVRQALGWDVPILGVVPDDESVHVNQVQFRVPVAAEPEAPFSQAIERLATALYPTLSGVRTNGRRGGVLKSIKHLLGRL